jgi:acyl-coenzyme A thioesterase PaaI-like protein
MSHPIRARTLAALAAARVPGFHFAGHFFGVKFGRLAPGSARVSLEGGSHATDTDGRINAGVVAMLADIALASSVRAAIGSDSTRLATVSMNLQFTGAALRGGLAGEGVFQGFAEHAAARQGLARFAIEAEGRVACFGTGAFMPLPPPPGRTMHPVTREFETVPALDESMLDAREREVLARADDAIAAADANRAFVSRFLGYEAVRDGEGATATLRNGMHVGNRVGHAQGGLLVGLGAASAGATLPGSWRLAAISAWFVSPGEGAELTARSTRWHQGRDTAVVRTEIAGGDGRRALEMVSAHARAAEDS